MDSTLIANAYVLFGYALLIAGVTLNLAAQHTRWGQV